MRSFARSRPRSAPSLSRTGPTRHWLFAVFPLLLLVGGCAMGRGERPDPGAQQDETVFLDVENQNFQDARIYVIWEGFRSRAGLVNGNSRQTLRLQGRDGQVRVEVDFVAGGGFVTDPMQVWRGERLRLIIPPGF